MVVWNWNKVTASYDPNRFVKLILHKSRRSIPVPNDHTVFILRLNDHEMRSRILDNLKYPNVSSD